MKYKIGNRYIRETNKMCFYIYRDKLPNYPVIDKIGSYEKAQKKLIEMSQRGGKE